MNNTLYYGDNLDILQRYIESNSIDLIYLDPPFNSKRDYNVLYPERDGSRSTAQKQTFKDTWKFDDIASEMFIELVKRGNKLSEALLAFEKLLGQSPMLAYLVMMAPRLAVLHTVLKPTGSIYLHCDPTASHYLKVLMDVIFGDDQFRNEIIWRRTSAHGSKRSFGPVHDTILFYTKTKKYYFHPVKRPYMREHVERRYTQDDMGRHKFTSGGNVLTGPGKTQGESGKPWRGVDPSAKDRHWAVPGFLAEQMPPEFKQLSTLDQLETLYQAGLVEINPDNAWPTPVRYLGLDDGQTLQDIWAYQPYTEGTVYGMKEGIDADVAWLGTTDPERSGYQTQKPLGLLARIIRSSCPPEGVILDPFCGCGTTVIKAQQLGFNWIGIDVTSLAINEVKRRLLPAKEKIDYQVKGIPTTVTEAHALALQDRFRFEAWVLDVLGARQAEDVRTGKDHHIDGRLYFSTGEGTEMKLVLFSVKSGKKDEGWVHDLRGVMARDNAEIGVLVTLMKPTPTMISDARTAGFYESPWGKHPKLQILTVKDILEDGKRVSMPHPNQTNRTFKRLAKTLAEINADQLDLGIPDDTDN